MNKVEIGTTTLLAGSLGSCGVAVYYIGQVMNRLSGDQYYALAAFGAVYPLLMLILANLNERVKKIVLFISGALAILGSYVLMLQSPNTIPILNLDTVPLVMYFMAVGGQISLFIMGASEVLRRARDTGFLPLGIGLAAGFAMIGFIVIVSMLGWLYMLMVTNYIIPAAMLLYFLVYPEGKEGEAAMRLPQSKPVVKEFHVADTWKGFKLAIYSVIVNGGVVAIVGVNGLVLAQEEYFTTAPIFWSLAAVGAIVASIIAKIVLGKIIGMAAGAKKTFTSNITWLVLASIQGGLVIGVASLEFFLPDFHMSIASHVIGGAVVGFSVGIYFAVLPVQHPPRSNYAFYMFTTYFVVLGMVLGSFIRAQGASLSQFYDLAQYVYYLLAALALITLLLVVNQVITIAKTRKVARDAPAMTSKPI